MADKLFSFASNPMSRSNWGATVRRAMFCTIVGVCLCSPALAQTYEENLANGAATTEQNFLKAQAPVFPDERGLSAYTHLRHSSC